MVRSGLALNESEEVLQNLVRVGLFRRLGLRDSAGSLVRTMELDRLAEACDTPFLDDDIHPRHVVEQDPLPLAYARQIRALRGIDRVHLTPVGRVFLELHGKEEVRWLLHVEVELALGQWDERRLSLEAARALLDQPSHSLDIRDQSDGFPCARALLSRLRALQVLAFGCDSESDPNCEGYTLYESGKALLTELVERRETPFRILAQALVKDETHQVFASLQTPALAQALRQSSAESVALQARLVTHEMGNALGPAQVALDQLTSALESARSPASLAPFCQRIEQGLDRAFRFLEDLKTTTSLGDARESFVIEEALRQAIDEVAGDRPITLDAAPPLPPLRGHRSRFVLAMQDVLRNALHAAPKDTGKIMVSVRLAMDQVLLSIDDNGPGVPAELRQAIFAAGFTLRPGGSGQGLALLKQVVEQELAGTVTCEDSPLLGGARFHLRLPLFPGDHP